MALAFTGFFLNLFNLVPVSPLDGGRPVAALHPALWVVRLAMLLGLVILWPNPIIFIVLLLGAMDVWQRWRNRRRPQAGGTTRSRPGGAWSSA